MDVKKTAPPTQKRLEETRLSDRAVPRQEKVREAAQATGTTPSPQRLNAADAPTFARTGAGLAPTQMRAPKEANHLDAAFAAPIHRADLTQYRKDVTHANGTSGRVSTAFHLGLGREVVLKSMESVNAEMAELETDIMKAYAAHPGQVPGRQYLVRFIELLAQQDRIYIAMEKAPGKPLSEHLPMSPAIAVKAMIHVAQALGHLHELGWVHRDVKPANIMMVPDDPHQVTLLDFGIARRLDRGGFYQGDSYRTPAYAAPENIVGQASRSSDVFSLAKTLETVIGKKQVPKDLAAVLALALSSDPAARPQTMASFIALLEPFTK